MPPANTLPEVSNPTMPQSANILAAAPQGVRTFVHLPIRNSGELDKLNRATRYEKLSVVSPLAHARPIPVFVRTHGERFEPCSKHAEKRRLPDDDNLARSGRRRSSSRCRAHVRHPAEHPHDLLEETRRSRRRPCWWPIAGPYYLRLLRRMGAHVAAFGAAPPMQSAIMKVQDAGFKPSNRNGPTGFYWFDDLKQAYEYPSYNVAHGTGTTIAIVGVADWLQSDQDLYFGHEGLPSPTIIRRPVDGGPPPFALTGAALEMSADIEQSGGSAPGATLITYQGPNALNHADISSICIRRSSKTTRRTSRPRPSAFVSCSLRQPYNGGEDFTSILQDFHDIFRQRERTRHHVRGFFRR